MQAAKNSILNEKLSFILVKDDNITKPTKEKFLFPFYKAFFIFTADGHGCFMHSNVATFTVDCF